MFVRIEFVDPTYTKYLTLRNVYFKNEDGLVLNFLPFTTVLQKAAGYTILKTLLIEPSLNAVIQYGLQISGSSGLRTLAGLEDSESKYVLQNFKTNIS